jgi:HK97 family phage major capsid protein
MSDMLKKLIEERANVWEQTKSHLDTVEAEGREFTGEADETYTRLNSRMSELDKRIDEVHDLEQRNKRADEIRAQYAGKGLDPERVERSQMEKDNDVLRAMVNGERRSFEFRDLVKSTSDTPKAGYTVPTSFLNQLHEHMVETSAIRRSNVTVINTDSGEDLQVPKTTTHPTAGIIAEAASITESDPVFGQVTLGAYKYAFSVQVSSELEQDTGVDLAGYLARQGGIALGNGSGAHFVTGSGSSQPNGVITASTLGVTGGAGVTGAFTVDNLIDLYYSVIDPYRRNGTWLMADAAIKAARKLKDATSGEYLWNNSVLADEPSTLLGRPVLNDTNVADPALSAKSVAFGDLSAYMIRDVRGVRVERSVDYAFANDLVTWRFLFRTDGDLIDTTGAVKHFIGNAA